MSFWQWTGLSIAAGWANAKRFIGTLNEMKTWQHNLKINLLPVYWINCVIEKVLNKQSKYDESFILTGDLVPKNNHKFEKKLSNDVWNSMCMAQIV